MKNIIVLYNPYYQEDVIEQHLKILKEKGVVSFGKIRSKLRNYESPNEDELNNIYENISREIPLQLFLTDYNNIYVANVIAVKKDKKKFIQAPMYYDELDVEKWFIFDDLRLLVHENFAIVRDEILANFKATNYNNHTYAVYGNQYVYPMQVTMKEDINYFLKDDVDYKYYTDIFKSNLQLQIRQNIIDFTFGTNIFYKFASNTQDNLISAEVEYRDNKQNPLYDCSSIVIKYSKAVELELHRFMKVAFSFLMKKDSSLENIPYSIQGRNYHLIDILEHKANYGTYKFLIKSYQIKEALNKYISKNSIRFFISSTISYFINTMQDIRNESVHGGATSLEECDKIRNKMMGIEHSSFLSDLIINKDMLD